MMGVNIPKNNTTVYPHFIHKMNFQGSNPLIYKYYFVAIMKNHNFQFFKSYLLAVFCALSIKSSAQSLKSYDKVEIQTLYINAKDSQVRFQVLSENKSNKFD